MGMVTRRSILKGVAAASAVALMPALLTRPDKFPHGWTIIQGTDLAPMYDCLYIDTLEWRDGQYVVTKHEYAGDTPIANADMPDDDLPVFKVDRSALRGVAPA